MTQYISRHPSQVKTQLIEVSKLISVFLLHDFSLGEYCDPIAKLRREQWDSLILSTINTPCYFTTIPQIGIFSLVKYSICKIFFVQSKFHRQTLAIKIGIGRRMLHEIFCVFNFRRKRSSTKKFNNENFVIQGIFVM